VVPGSSPGEIMIEVSFLACVENTGGERDFLFSGNLLLLGGVFAIIATTVRFRGKVQSTPELLLPVVAILVQNAPHESPYPGLYPITSLLDPPRTFQKYLQNHGFHGERTIRGSAAIEVIKCGKHGHVQARHIVS
jgi:hypothetical protein